MESSKIQSVFKAYTWKSETSVWAESTRTPKYSNLFHSFFVEDKKGNVKWQRHNVRKFPAHTVDLNLCPLSINVIISDSSIGLYSFIHMPSGLSWRKIVFISGMKEKCTCSFRSYQYLSHVENRNTKNTFFLLIPKPFSTHSTALQYSHSTRIENKSEMNKKKNREKVFHNK